MYKLTKFILFLWYVSHVIFFKHALCNLRLILSLVCCKYFNVDFNKHDSYSTIEVHIACITNALDHGNFIYNYFVQLQSTFSEHCKLIKYVFKAKCKSIFMNSIV